MSSFLSKEWAEYLSRYSYITKAEVKGVFLYLYYIVDGDLKKKRVSRRVSPKQLKFILDKIKTEKGIDKNEQGTETKAFIA